MMKLHARVFTALAFLAFADRALAQSEPARAPTAYVRVQANGAKLRNLPDIKGEPVLDAAPSALLAVYSERAGWLEVEPASGMKVWIHGSFLKPTTAGMVELTANSVRMRPLPSSDEKSFPLPMKLDKGERVRVIARADAQKPLAEDWVQVWSPPGARAFVAAADTTPLASGTSGDEVRKAWSAEVKTAQASMVVVDLTADASASKKAAPAEKPAAAGSAAPAGAKTATAQANAVPAGVKANPAVEQLAEAEKLMTTARASANPDYTAAKKAYQAVLASAPQGMSAATSQARLDEIEVREEIQRLKVDKATFEKERTEKLADAEAKLREVNKRQDPLWGRFQARGWLEADAPGTENPRYILRWGGQQVAEICCASGRYDLSKFAGFEVGIQGITQRAAVPSANGDPGTPARIDATRIEVISAHLGR